MVDCIINKLYARSPHLEVIHLGNSESGTVVLKFPVGNEVLITGKSMSFWIS